MDSVRPGIGQTGFVRQDFAGRPATTGASAAMPALAADELSMLGEIAAVLRGSRFALLTGAGLSTDSGIPDYRGPGSIPRSPLTYQEFVGDASLRRRYWARNHIGWAQMHRAEPNAGHFAAATLEHAGWLTGIVTQNVDRLHEDAGARNVVDLHGRFDKVACLQCGEVYARAFIAVILTELNPGFLQAVAAHPGVGAVPAAPDADADLDHEDLIGGFRVACCPLCGGMLKPDFVFFGENVPKDRVERAYAMVDDAGALLVAGSSLTVMSGLRFARKAAKDGKPVVIINRGATRGDPLATHRLEAGVGESLDYLSLALGSRLA